MKKTGHILGKGIVFAVCLLASLNARSANYYWVGGSGSWSDFSTHWATTSGGSSFRTQVPTANDDVFFDANSFTGAGQTVNGDNTVIYFHTMDWSGATNNPTFTQSTASSTINVFGSLTLISAMNWNVSGSVIFLSNSTGNTITSAGKTYKNRVDFEGSGGGWTLQDAMTLDGSVAATNSGLLTLDFGTLNTNGNAVTSLGFLSSNGNVRSLNMDNTVFTINYNGGNFNAWNTSSVSNYTFSATGSTINFSGTYPYPTFYSNNKTYNNVSFTYGSGIQQSIQGSGNTFNGTVSFSGICTGIGNNTFNGTVTFASEASITSDNTFNGAVNLTAGHAYIFQAGTTQTISATGTLNAVGTCTQPITIKSSTNGSQATISKVGGNLNVDQTIMQDMRATVSVGFSANATNSFDAGNNNNWVFPAFVGPSMYWIGGTGNWNDPNHWSFTSGGAPGSCIPGPGNDVFFDANSFTNVSKTVTMNASTASCKSMSWTGAGFTPTFSSSSSTNTLKIYGSVTLIAAMNFNYDGGVSFESKTTGNTITSAGHVWPTAMYNNSQISFNGVGGSWSFQDAFSTNYIISLVNGTLNTNNQTVTCFYFESQYNNTRALNLGSSTWTCTGYYWLVSGSGMTLNAGTSTIRITYCCFDYFYGGGLTYNNVSLEGTSGTNSIQYSNIFNGTVTILGDGEIGSSNTFNGNLIFTPGKIYTLGAGQTQTIGASGSLTANGTCASYIMIASGQPGSQATITKVNGNLTADNTILRDINATVSVGFQANATNKSTDLGGNTNWNFGTNSGTNMYWVGGSGNWSDPNHWSLSSGGPAGVCIPGPTDNVNFDANSFTNASKNVTLDVTNALCRNMNWTGAGFTPTFQYSVSGYLRIYGSLTLISAMNFNYYGQLNFESGSAGNTITTAGHSIGSQVTFVGGSGGSWSLQDGFTTTNLMQLTSGTLNTNNQPVSCLYFYSYSGQPRALNLGSSIFTLTDYYWYVDSYNFTFNAGTSTLHHLNHYPYYGYPIYGAGLTYYNITFESGSNPGTLQGPGTFNGVVTFNGTGQIDGNNTFNGNVVFLSDGNITSSNTFNSELKFTSGKTYTVASGATQTFSGSGTLSFIAIGSPCAPIAISSSVNGSVTTFTKATGEVCADYLYLNSVRATGGATWSAGLHSTNTTPATGTGWQNILCSQPLQSSIITPSGPLCGAGSVTLSSRLASSYLWSTGATTQSIVISTPGTYTLSIVNLNGCTESGSLTIVSSAIPTCSITGSTSTCPSANETYTGPAGMTGYAWSISGPGSIPGSAIGSTVGIVPTGCGSYDLSVTVSNAAGCTSTCNIITAVVDNTAPTITCPANISTANATGLCGKNVTFSVTATDNCGTPNVVSTPASGSFFNTGTTTVTSVATDACGNSTSCTFTVTVTDNEAPVLTVPAAITINTDAGLCTSTASIGTATATDNCGTVTVSHSPLAPYAMGNTTVTWTAVDGQGFTTTGTQVVTVHDNQAPTISVPAAITINADAGLCTSTASIGTATGTDLCGTVTISHSPAAPYALGNTTVTWTANDGNGNTTTGTQVVTVTENQAPTISVPAAVTIHTDQGQCTSTASIGTATGTDACGTVTISHTPAAPYALGNTTVTWTADDGHGNTVTGTQVVTVTDNEVPTISVPAAITISADAGQCTSSASIGTATGSDNCGSVTISHSPAAPYALGNTTVTWTANDGHGNTTNGTQVVTVTDNEAPSISVPSAITISADAGQCTSTASIGTATGNDNCGSVTISHSPAAPYALGNTTVTWTANDGHGNTTSGTQIVTVTDNEAPSISVPSAITISADAGQCTSTASIGTATGTDICGTVTISHTPVAPYALGNTTVTWTANDGHGNTTTGTQVVTVTENQAPTISVPAATTITADAGQCTSTASIGTATGTDLCGTVTISHTPPAPYALGNTTVTWTADDGHGNTASGTQIVTVTDNQAPSISVPGAVTIHTDAGQCTSTASIGSATGNDNCGSVTISHSPAAPYALGNTTVTWTADDGHGNTTNGTQVVTVTDNENPTVTAPADITINGWCRSVSLADAGTSLGNATGSDNCGTVTYTNNAPSTFPVGTTNVTWTANDGHGNTATATQHVTVNQSTLSLTAVATNTTCNTANGGNHSNGSIATTVSGGTAAYTYAWSNGATCANPGSLVIGTYSVTVTDAHSCTTTGTATVGEPTAISISSITAANTSCNTTNGGNHSNGSIATTVSGGTGNLAYTWTGGATGTNPVGLAIGTYTLTVTDGNSCTATSTATVGEPAALAVSATATNVSCNSSDGGNHNDGGIATTVTGGTSAYSYAWTGGASGTNPSGLGTGTYTVTVTDAHTCTTTGSATVGQPTAISSTISGSTTVLGATPVTYDGPAGMATYSWSISGGDHICDSKCHHNNGHTCGSGCDHHGHSCTTACHHHASHVCTNNHTGDHHCNVTCHHGTGHVCAAGCDHYGQNCNSSCHHHNSHRCGHDHCGAATISGSATGASISVVTPCCASTYTLTLTTTNAAGCSSTSTLAATVTASATITVYSSLYTTGSGNHPTTSKTALAADMKVFNRSVVGRRDLSQSHYSTTYNSNTGLVSNVYVSGPVSVNIGGGPSNRYIITVPANGHYLVLGKSVVSSTTCGGTTCTIYTGSKVGNHDDVDADDDHDDEEDDNSCTNTILKFHSVLKDNSGKCKEGTTQQQHGSLMLMVSPASLTFTDSVALLPVIYESIDGTWDVSVSADPPYGFYSTPSDALSTNVTDSVMNAVQFEITDTGSEWTNTKLTHAIQHKGESRVAYSAPKMINDRTNTPSAIIISPNPADDHIKIELPRFEGKATINIYNLLGQKVAEQPINLMSGGTVTMDISKLVPGAYQVAIENTSGKASARLIKNSK